MEVELHLLFLFVMLTKDETGDAKSKEEDTEYSMISHFMICWAGEAGGQETVKETDSVAVCEGWHCCSTMDGAHLLRSLVTIHPVSSSQTNNAVHPVINTETESLSIHNQPDVSFHIQTLLI